MHASSTTEVIDREVDEWGIDEPEVDHIRARRTHAVHETGGKARRTLAHVATHANVARHRIKKPFRRRL